MIDTLMFILFICLGLACSMLLYLLIHLSMSLKTLGATIVEINKIVTRANTSVTRMVEFKNSIMQPLGMIGMVFSLVTIGLSNRVYKSLKK